MANILCLCTVMSFTQGLSGSVVEAFSRHPVNGSTIIISMGDSIVYQGISDSLGRYKFQTGRAGRLIVQITAVGFSPYEMTDVLLDGYTTLHLEHLLQQTSFDLAAVTVVAEQRDGASFIRTITPDDLLQFAGNFEDPVRIAHSQPGVVLLNDQANQISARGQAPIFNSWYLEGLEIVNPNHTSNAGTLSDQPTQYGGGVNMFSAQTLGSTDLYMGVNPLSVGSNTGAVVDMHLHESATPEWRAKAGLLGIELGGGAALGTKSILDFNLRYSFTGILTNLGADFGGEKINYYDGLVSFRHEGAYHKLKLFVWAGRSINEFEHIEPPEARERDKDFFDIDYANNILGAGGRYDVTLSPKLYLRSGFAYSTNQTSHTKTGAITGNPRTIETPATTSIASGFAEVSMLHSSRIQSIGGIDCSIKTFEVVDTPNETLRKLSTIRPYLTTTVELAPKWKLALGGELQYSSRSKDWIPGYRAQLDWSLSKQSTLFTGVRHSSSDPFYVAPHFSEYVHVLSTTYELGWTHAMKNQHVGVNVYYQQMNRLLAYPLSDPDDYVYEYIADYPNAFAGLLGRRSDGISRHQGIEAKWNWKTEKGWGMNINQSVYHSERGLPDSTLTSGRYNGQFATHISISKEIIREAGDKNRIWNFALRGIFNGGLWEPEIDAFYGYIYPVIYDQRLPAYTRIDAGVARTIAYKKIRWRYSLDIQNLLGFSNVAYHYYDHFQGQVVTQNQLGIIPVLSVQASW